MKSLTFFLTTTLAVICLAGIANGICNQNTDCNKGECLNSTCICFKGYVTFGNQQCGYKQKEKLTAFLLSFFIGNLGADWFYLASGDGGYIAAGIIKLLIGLFFSFGCCLLCCAGIFASVREKASSKAFGFCCGIFIMILIGLCVATSTIWYFVDWIRILTNSFKDGNGVSLKDWWMHSLSSFILIFYLDNIFFALNWYLYVLN